MKVDDISADKLLKILISVCIIFNLIAFCVGAYNVNVASITGLISGAITFAILRCFL